MFEAPEASLQPHRLGPRAQKGPKGLSQGHFAARKLAEWLLREPREVDVEELLELSGSVGALDAKALALGALGRRSEAFELLLDLNVAKALDFLEEKAV